jgi:hypothetical protein
MSQEITGILHEIFDEEQVSEKFKKLAFVLLYYPSGNQQWPEYIRFELHGGNTGLLDSYNEGEEVTVHFNLRGRLWTNPQGKKFWFNTFVAWRFQRGDDHAVRKGNSTYGSGNMPQSTTFDSTPQDDDLPF